jgi:hypothetical protein
VSNDDHPVLTPETIADDEALAEAVDAIVLQDEEARRWNAEGAIYEEALRAIVEPDTWQVYLRLEELHNARWSELLLVIARWGFTEGVKSASRRREST